MGTVFQAFFISYLVKLGYGKKFETYEELLHSSVSYAYNDAAKLAMARTSYREHEKVPYSRHQECMKRIANHSQVCIINAESFSQYLGSEMGIRDSSKYLRSLEENLATSGLTSLLRNGSPFLKRLNQLTRRSLERGLLGRYWTQLLLIKNLKTNVIFLYDENDLYFIFS